MNLRHLNKWILTLSLGLMLWPLQSIAATSPAFTEDQKKAIQETVREYLKNNPDVVLEILNNTKTHMATQQDESTQKALEVSYKQIEQNPTDPVAGNPKGNITVVEFFDYQCSYCKSSVSQVKALLEKDKNVRFVFKEYPILSPVSSVAARAALAAHRQGKYLPFHYALMETHDRLDTDAILAIAKSQGLDTEKMKKDMEDPALIKVLVDNYDLAQKLGIRGTPTFIIGQKLFPGGITVEEMQQYIDQARSEKSSVKSKKVG